GHRQPRLPPASLWQRGRARTQGRSCHPALHRCCRVAVTYRRGPGPDRLIRACYREVLMRHLLITLALLFPILAMAAPRTVDWLDLLPEEDYQAMLDMPEISHDWGTEAPGDFSNSLRSPDRNLPEVMYSTRVVGEMDGQHIELGGYPVPLETDEQGRYISFFLVPYPGACI